MGEETIKEQISGLMRWVNEVANIKEDDRAYLMEELQNIYDRIK